TPATPTNSTPRWTPRWRRCAVPGPRCSTRRCCCAGSTTRSKRWRRCASAVSPPGSCPTTCTSSTGSRAPPISKWTTPAHAPCTPRWPRACPATWSRGWCARCRGIRASGPCERDRENRPARGRNRGAAANSRLGRYSYQPHNCPRGINEHMSNGADKALRLMIVDDSVEAAEAIVNVLRNAGIAVRPLRPESLEALGEQVGERSIDLVLAAQAAKDVPLPQVLDAIKDSGKDLPVVVVVDQVDDAALTHALAAGVRGIALRHQPQQLLGVVRTEWSDLQARRSLRRLEAQVREIERRCDALIESSRDPIAYIHEGMHIRAHSASMEMFGFESFDGLEGMSLLDMVAPKHVDAFRTLLKAMSKGEAPPPRHELEARDGDGNPFPAVMEFTPASYEGEPCLQVVFRRQELDPELAREVEELRQRDQVTGLLNRPTFLQALE